MRIKSIRVSFLFLYIYQAAHSFYLAAIYLPVARQGSRARTPQPPLLPPKSPWARMLHGRNLPMSTTAKPAQAVAGTRYDSGQMQMLDSEK